MKSRITIDFKGLDAGDGNQFEPIIRASVEDSDDPRDGLMKAFFQALGGDSNWLEVDIWNVNDKENIRITPVRPKNILDTMTSMINRVPINEATDWLKGQLAERTKL